MDTYPMKGQCHEISDRNSLEFRLFFIFSKHLRDSADLGSAVLDRSSKSKSWKPRRQRAFLELFNEGKNSKNDVIEGMYMYVQKYEKISIAPPNFFLYNLVALFFLVAFS
jgi:hypothetical protein